MTIRSFLFLVLVGSVVAWAAFLSVLFFVDPPQVSGIIGLLAFYLTAFIASLGTLTFLGVGWRVSIRKRHDTAFREVRIAFRHAILLSLFSLGLLLLSSQGWLNWPVFLMLFAALGCMEYLLLLMDEGRRS